VRFWGRGIGRAWALAAAPSFTKMRSRCLATVRGRVARMAPTSGLVYPSATQARISASRAVRPRGRRLSGLLEQQDAPAGVEDEADDEPLPSRSTTSGRRLTAGNLRDPE
jgi:hypothetical protein